MFAIPTYNIGSPIKVYFLTIYAMLLDVWQRQETLREALHIVAFLLGCQTVTENISPKRNYVIITKMVSDILRE